MRGDSMMLVSIFPFADFAHAIFLLPTAANDCAGMLPREKKTSLCLRPASKQAFG
jgi:hypothetical protein